MKPKIWLDSTLPKNHTVPVNPDTRGPWIERHEELIALSAKFNALSPNAVRMRKKIQRQFDELKSGLKFVEAPYFIRKEKKVCGGETMMRVTCNPATFFEMPAEFQERYEAVPA